MLEVVLILQHFLQINRAADVVAVCRCLQRLVKDVHIVVPIGVLKEELMGNLFYLSHSRKLTRGRFL